MTLWLYAPPQPPTIKKIKPTLCYTQNMIKRNHISVLSSVRVNTIKQNRIFRGAQRRQVSNLSFSFLCIFMVCFIKARTIWWYIVSKSQKKITNIYSETHPQWKYFSSKQVRYDDENPYAQTIPKTMSSFFGWRRKVGREGQEKESMETLNSLKVNICSVKMKTLIEKWVDTFLAVVSHFRDGAGVPVYRKGPGPHLPLGKSQPSIF